MPSLRSRLGRLYYRSRLATTTIDEIRSREVRPMLRRIDLQRTDTVLDLGCAAGVWTHWLGRRTNRAVGVDVDKLVIEAGQRIYSGVELVAGDGQSLPFPDDTFDKVVFISTLEHIDDPERAMAEIARVLKPGGRLAISVDTLDHPAWKPRREEHARRSFVVQYFSREQLLEIADRHGFEADWGRYLYGNPVSPVLLSQRLKPSNLHWLLAPAVRLSGKLDAEDAGMMYHAVMTRRAA